MALQQVCAVAVMAKAPRPGHVKTRLQSLLTADEAAALGGAFLSDVTANIQEAARHAPIHGYVAFAPAGQEARFDGLIAPGTRLVLADGTDGAGPGVDGFGRSLLHAMRALLSMGYGAACLVSADSPTLPTAWLVRAATRMLAPGRRAAIGPADDGGYWLIGMQQPEPALFAGIAWSTDTVAARTVAQAEAIGLDIEAMGTWFDVDDAEGLAQLTQPPPGTDPPFAAPATRRAMQAMDLVVRLKRGGTG